MKLRRPRFLGNPSIANSKIEAHHMLLIFVRTKIWKAGIPEAMAFFCSWYWTSCCCIWLNPPRCEMSEFGFPLRFIETPATPCLARAGFFRPTKKNNKKGGRGKSISPPGWNQNMTSSS